MGRHTVRLGADHVVKRFGAHREAARREWRALRLLASHAPGLAPAPLSAGFGADGPVLTMSRLPGRPLRGETVDGLRTAALAEAVQALHAAVPAAVLAKVPPRPGGPRELVTTVREWAAQRRLPGGEVAAAADLALDGLSETAPGPADGPGARPVFGAGDGNLANYLWDGSRVRVVDFEESGRSDRAFELAEITEHVSAWAEHPLDVAEFLACFELPDAERARLAACRRLIALVWLFLLAFDEAAGRPRNPPGTAVRQARRLTALLS